MKRNRSTLLGASLAAVTMLVFIVGCSTSNPVAPQTSGIQYENTENTDQILLSGPGGNPDVVTADEVITESVAKSTPSIGLVDDSNPVRIDGTRIENLRIE